jgi:hypothetical protein
MAVGMIMNFPGVTQEQYDTVMEQLNLGGRMPPGGDISRRRTDRRRLASGGCVGVSGGV